MAYAVGHRTQAGARAYANALERIVSNGGAIGEVPRDRRGTVSYGGGGTAYEYNGYFKIIDASEYDEEGGLVKPIVKVVDGKSYSPETGESEAMLFSVNGFTYPVQSATIPLQNKYSQIGLMVHLHRTGTSSAPYTASIETYINTPPPQTTYDFYKSFGRVFFTTIAEEGKTKRVLGIYQDHESGILEATWYISCGDLVNE